MKYNLIAYTMFSDNIKFETPIKTHFSSLALMKYFIAQNTNVRLTFFVPESLVDTLKIDLDGIHSKDIEDTEDDVRIRLLRDHEKLKEIILKELSNKENKIISSEDLSRIDLKIIPSKGKYTHYTYQSSIHNIILEILGYFLKKLEGIEEIYLDISTGHNIFLSALIEAARKYITYLKLKEILQEDNKDEKGQKVLKILYGPPIFSNTKDGVIELYNISVKAFFSYPYPKFERCFITNNGESQIFNNKELFHDKDYLSLKRSVTGILNEVNLAFNSLKFNIPLAFYHEFLFSLKKQVEEKDLDKDSDICEMDYNQNEGNDLKNQFIDFILQNNLAQIHRTDKSIIIKRQGLNSGAVSNIIFSFALYSAFRKFKETLNEEATIDEIREKFIKIYKLEKMGLLTNQYFLEKDLENIEDQIKQNAEKAKEYILLKELFNTGGSSDVKRNFFAHSGFTYDYTMVKLKQDQQGNQKIYLKWIDKGPNTERIQKTIKNLLKRS
ncbi:MAG: TM1812 family CRISPR-associated protein [Promethearchaeota archaeon]